MNGEKKADWVDPGFVGLMALAAAVASLWPILTGIVPPTAVPMVIGWMFITGVALIICGVICLRVGNLPVGAPCVMFGAVINWGTAASFAIEIWGKANGMQINGAPLNGWVFLVIGFLAVGIGWPFGFVSWLMWIWVMILAVAFWLAGLGFLGVLGPGFIALAGWLLLIFNIICLYLAIAGHINTAAGGKMPLGSPLFK